MKRRRSLAPFPRVFRASMPSSGLVCRGDHVTSGTEKWPTTSFVTFCQTAFITSQFTLLLRHARATRARAFPLASCKRRGTSAINLERFFMPHNDRPRLN